MDAQELLQKCGVEIPRTPRRPVQWYPAKIQVLGAENYVLLEFSTEVRFLPAKGGFISKFKNKLSVPAESLMGPCIREVIVCDIVIDAGFLQLSLANLRRSGYPCVLREGETLHVVS